VYGDNLTFEATGETLLFEEMKKDEEKENRNKEAVRLYEQGLTQEQIAKKLGCSPSTVQRALKGRK